MATTRTCDICRMSPQNLDGTSKVNRYGLSRQVKVPGVHRPNRPDSLLFKRERHHGGIDMCDECWDKIAKPKTRPHTRAKAGHPIHPVDTSE